MITYVILWAVLFAAFVIAELATTQMISVWLAIGALFAALVASLGIPLWGQLVVFVAVSGVLLALTRSIAARLLKGKPVPTNAELNIGKKAVVIEKISAKDDTGRARLNGVDWKAVSLNGEEIDKGELVFVKQIDGAKIIVQKAPVNTANITQ